MSILSALVLIALLVFIHEFGHFIVAKWCGVHCSVLSIGYGKRLIGFEWKGTDYRLSLLPFGGYVRMAGADPFGYGDEDDHLLENPEDAFMRKPVWKRLLIVAAGPAFNLMLPIVVITGLLMAGEPQPAPSVGKIYWDSPSHRSEIQLGDKIIAINDQATDTWEKMRLAVKTLSVGKHQITVDRNGSEIVLDLDFKVDAEHLEKAMKKLEFSDVLKEKIVMETESYSKEIVSMGLDSNPDLQAERFDTALTSIGLLVNEALTNRLAQNLSPTMMAEMASRPDDILSLVLETISPVELSEEVPDTLLADINAYSKETLALGSDSSDQSRTKQFNVLLTSLSQSLTADIMEKLEPQILPESLGIGYMRPDAIIGVDDSKSPAGKAGLQTGDRITSVNGQSIDDYVGLQQQLFQSSDVVHLVVERQSKSFETEMKLEDWRTVGAQEIPGTDVRWGIFPGTMFVAIVSDQIEDSSGFAGCTRRKKTPPPAYDNGILAGDRFSRINGQSIRNWSDVVTSVSNSVDVSPEDIHEESEVNKIDVELVRNGQLISMPITPTMIKDTDATGRYRYRPILGVQRSGDFVEGPKARRFYGFVDAFDRAVTETVFISGFIVEQLGKLITGEAAVEKSIGGPVEIVRQASDAAEAGLFQWVRLMALLSISLGIVNLAPVPVLDGGQILFYLAEAIRGRPLSPRIREYALQIGVLFIVMLMLMVLFFDINRWIGG